MFFKRSFRYALSGLTALRVVNDINELGYSYTLGYCQGLVTSYCLSRLKMKIGSFNTWITALKATPNFGKHFKAIEIKKGTQSNLTENERAILEKLPTNPRYFLDEVALFQNTRISSHQPFLVNRSSHQGEVLEGLRSVDEEYAEGMVEIFRDAVIKTPAEAQQYLESIAAILREDPAALEMDYVVVLTNSKHTITCSPNLFHNHWEFFDPAQMEVIELNSSEVSAEIHQAFLIEEAPISMVDIIKAFLSGLLCEKYSAYSIKIISLSSNLNLPAVTLKLQQFKEQQVITPEIAYRRTRYGTTLAHIAARNGITDIVEKLSQFGNSLNLAMQGEWRPLHEACDAGYFNIVNIFIKNGIDPREILSDGVSPLMLAARNGNPETIQLLIEEYKKTQPSFINAQNNFNATALIYAANNGNLAAVYLLLSNGASPFIGNKNNITPLMAAAISGFAEIADIIAQKMVIVGKEISLTEADIEGYSAADMAAMYGHDEVIRTLAKYQKFSQESGQKLLHLAIANGYPRVIKALYEAQVPIHLNSEDESTKIVFNLAHLAVHHKNIYVIRCLAELGFNFTQETPQSNGSAITWAIQNEEWDLVAYMLMSTSENLSERDNRLLSLNQALILKAYQTEKGFAPMEKQSNILANLLEQTEEKKSDWRP